MAFIKMLIAQGFALVSRYPWAIAIFGFVSGVASFFLVEREQEKFAQIVSALMLVSWIWLALENLLQRSVSSWFGIKLPPPLLSFATQLVHQESLFFVVPFFFITTVWNGGQAIFTVLLIIAALVSIIDPIYYRWLAARRWLYFIFHGVTLFVVLLTALPIIFHLPTPKSYLWSLVIALLLTLPGVIRALPFQWWKRVVITIILISLVGVIGISVRPWIPPATLRLTEVAITDRIDNKSRAPQNELKVVTVEQLRAGLYAYTAIRAPRGLNERIYHVWRRNGRVVDKIALDINGGREAGYRAWTHKMNFPPYPKGRWQIHVVTEANQVLGILRFQVVESLEQVGSGDSQPPEQRDLDDPASDGAVNEQDESTDESSYSIDELNESIEPDELTEPDESMETKEQNDINESTNTMSANSDESHEVNREAAEENSASEASSSDVDEDVAKDVEKKSSSADDGSAAIDNLPANAPKNLPANPPAEKPVQDSVEQPAVPESENFESPTEPISSAAEIREPQTELPHEPDSDAQPAVSEPVSSE